MFRWYRFAQPPANGFHPCRGVLRLFTGAMDKPTESVTSYIPVVSIRSITGYGSTLPGCRVLIHRRYGQVYGKRYELYSAGIASLNHRLMALTPAGVSVCLFTGDMEKG